MDSIRAWSWQGCKKSAFTSKVSYINDCDKKNRPTVEYSILLIESKFLHRSWLQPVKCTLCNNSNWPQKRNHFRMTWARGPWLSRCRTSRWHLLIGCFRIGWWCLGWHCIREQNRSVRVLWAPWKWWKTTEQTHLSFPSLKVHQMEWCPQVDYHSCKTTRAEGQI